MHPHVIHSLLINAAFTHFTHALRAHMQHTGLPMMVADGFEDAKTVEVCRCHKCLFAFRGFTPSTYHAQFVRCAIVDINIASKVFPLAKPEATNLKLQSERSSWQVLSFEPEPEQAIALNP